MTRTNLTIIDSELWKWAKKRTIDLNKRNISEYIFYLIKEEKKKVEGDTFVK